MIDWAERTVCILISLGILANALMVRRIVQAWAFPAVIFSLAWFFYTIVPLVCFPDAHVYPSAMLYILGASLAFSAGSFSNWRAAFETSARVKAGHEDYYSGNMLLIIFAVSAILTILFLLLNSISQGISIGQLVNNINDSAAEYAGRRYAYDIAPNFYQQTSNILAYYCSAFGGIILLSHKNIYTRFAIVVGALFPPLFVMMSQSARGMLFLCAAIFYAGIMIARFQKNIFSLLSRRALPVLIFGLLLVIPLVTASFIARGVSSGAGQSLLDALAPYWASYTSGHLFAFSDWFGNYTGQPSAQLYDDPGMTGGFYTFMSIFKLFGDDRPVPLGVYGEYLVIPPYIGTNIYTMFRGMIHDYGITGSLVFLTLLSYLFHRSYRAILISAMPAISASVFIFMIAFIYQSFIISAFMWTTLMIGVFLVGITLYIFRLSIFSMMRNNPPHILRQRIGSIS